MRGEPARSRPSGTPRLRWLAAWLVTCAVCATGAFAAGQLLVSPWDDAVENSHATLTTTAVVESRDFTPAAPQALGVASLGATISIAPPAVTQRTVVTAAHKEPGDVLAPGEILAEVSGRPVLALNLPFSLYRDLAPGMTGADVRAVEQALKDLGLYRYGIDDTYGPKLAAAVRALYARVHMSPPAALEDLQQSTVPARQAAALPDPAADAASADPTPAQSAADTPLPLAEVIAVPPGGYQVVSVQGVGTVIGDDTPDLAQVRAASPQATVRVPVPAEESFAVGQQVRVSPVTDTSTTWTGTVTGVSPFRPADDTHDMPGYDATIALTDTPSLADGDQVTAQPATPPAARRGLAVPLTALREDHGTYVLVVGDGAQTSPGSTARRRDVTVVTSQDGWALIAGDGLSEGDHVVTSGTP